MERMPELEQTAMLKEWQSRWEAGLDQQAMAIWRLPFAEEMHFIRAKQAQVLQEEVPLENLGKGFLVAGFEGPAQCIPAEEHWQGPLQPLDLPLSPPGQIPLSQEEAPRFKAWVKDAVESIRQGKFQKVVLSRTDRALLPESFALMSALQALCTAYPNALVAAFHLPGTGATWLCASPEILVEQDAQAWFKTYSLAGTQAGLDAQGREIPLQAARWSQKEIEEQALVSRYIIDCFKKIRLREYHENGPKTMRAGNLMHLKTEYLVDTKQVRFPNLAGTMLQLLHPTSAVCGMPKAAAIEWIHRAERHDRGMYSGYLGPVQWEGGIHLYVNLRTVQLQGKQACFYAGCGITEDSDPDMEWEETQMKCLTLKTILWSL